MDWQGLYVRNGWPAHWTILGRGNADCMPGLLTHILCPLISGKAS